MLLHLSNMGEVVEVVARLAKLSALTLHRQAWGCLLSYSCGFGDVAYKAAPGKFEAERFASTTQEWLFNSFI